VSIKYGNCIESVESFTRTLNISFLVTIIEAFNITNLECLPNNLSQGVKSDDSTRNTKSDDQRLALESNPCKPNEFIFTFDLMNEWNEPFNINFEIYNGN
jgi:hypothetical protein